MFLRLGFQGFRFLSTNSSTITKWDPTVSLQLNHTSLVLLENCCSRDHFKQIVAQIMRINLICHTFPMSRLIYNSSITNPENLDLALLLFKHFTPNPNLFIYNTMISSLSSSGFDSFSVYGSMLSSRVYPDKHTLLYLVKSSKCLFTLKQVHVHAIVTGLFEEYEYLQNSLIKFYIEKGEVGLAHKVFVNMSKPDKAAFNILIVDYAKRGLGLEAFELFFQMKALGIEADEFTTLGLLLSCRQLGDLRIGKSVHSWIERRELFNLILCNALIDMYVECEELGIAKRVFDGLSLKDVVSWNTMIAGFAKAGEMESAKTLFDQMPKKDIVSWNSLITGYVHKHDHVIALNLFKNMVSDNFRPDDITAVALISAMAETGRLELGRWIHGLIIRLRIKVDAFLVSSLIDMYCKCGSLERAFTMFMTLTDKDVTVWTAMISGFAFHGYGNKALDLFAEMQKYVNPNAITFIAILTACNHCGLVTQGVQIFHSMKETYNIEPGIEHYGCLVDLFSRSGRLDKANDVIKKMPMKPSRSIWGSVLSSCREHRDVEMAEVAVAELLKMEPEKEGGYVLMSNVYAGSEKWKYSDGIRKLMENRGVKKIAGCSSVVVDGDVYHFVAADKKTPRSVDVQLTVDQLHDEMKFVDKFHLSFLQPLDIERYKSIV